MYILNNNKNVIKEGCYILKQDLQCNRGIFTAGSRVRITRFSCNDDCTRYAYHVESAGDDDFLYLDKKAPIVDWIEKMLTEDAKATSDYQSLVDNFERTRSAANHNDDIKERWLWVVLIVVFVIGLAGFVVAARGGIDSVLVAAFKWIVGIFLATVLQLVYRHNYVKTMDTMRDTFDKQCDEILSDRDGFVYTKGVG